MEFIALSENIRLFPTYCSNFACLRAPPLHLHFADRAGFTSAIANSPGHSHNILSGLSSPCLSIAPHLRGSGVTWISRLRSLTITINCRQGDTGRVQLIAGIRCVSSESLKVFGVEVESNWGSLIPVAAGRGASDGAYSSGLSGARGFERVDLDAGVDECSGVYRRF